MWLVDVLDIPCAYTKGRWPGAARGLQVGNQKGVELRGSQSRSRGGEEGLSPDAQPRTAVLPGPTVPKGPSGRVWLVL